MTTNRPEPTLAELTEKAIEILNKDKDGFFLMVEGSQIDWESHGSNPEGVIKQVLCFDMAVKAAVDFAMKDKKTLVIVTADHETGGLVVKGRDSKTGELQVGWGSDTHTASAVPVYAYGPGSKAFGGVYDNTEIAKKMGKALRLKSFPEIKK